MNGTSIMPQAKCKISRRLGVNIFPKCGKIFARRPYPPGPKKKRRAVPLSEYGKELREKQKLQYLYNLRERQFSNYVKKVLAVAKKGKDAQTLLLQLLELRLDNVAFRLGFAKTRHQARQLVSHGHFMVNKRRITVPSYQLKVGDEISIRPGSKNKIIFQDLEMRLKNYQLPSWLELDKKNFVGKVINLPSFEEVVPPAETSSIIEFYSR